MDIVQTDEIGKRCAESITPALFEPVIKRVTDDLYERLLNSVQDYLCDNTKYNIATRIATAERSATLAYRQAQTLRSRLSALEALAGDMAGALGPFGELGVLANFAFAPALFHDRDEIKGLPWKDDGRIVTITFGDLRQAAQSLTAWDEYKRGEQP